MNIPDVVKKRRIVSGPVNENQITQLKNFYKTHLANVKDVRIAVSELREMIPKLEERIDTSAIGRISPSNIELQGRVEEILEKHFPSSLIELYKKNVQYDNSRDVLRTKDYDNAFQTFLSILNTTIQGMNKQYQMQAEYEVRLLKYIEFCLINYGLHPKIESRDEKEFKQFNLLIKHKTHSRTIIEDYKVLLSWTDFHSNFVEYYKKRLPVKIGGKLIPFDKIVEVKITTTKLKGRDEIQMFFRKKGIPFQDKQDNERNLIVICNDETEKFLPNPYAKEIEVVAGNDPRATKIALIEFPNALKLFNDAMQKYNDPALSRNCLDDLRLCLETLLKEKLKNSKSLEKQTQALGTYIKDKGGDTNITGLLHNVIDFYSKYQNNNVKHNDNAKQGDMKFIFNLTSTLIIHLSEI